MQPPTQDKELSILNYLFQSAASDNDVYHKITDFFPALVYVYDPDTKKLVYINKKISDVLGYSYDDLKAWDHNFMNVVFSADVDLVKQELKKFRSLEYPGSGVELAICKKIIERHGGLIHVKSTPGEGSVFTIILPQKQF